MILVPNAYLMNHGTLFQRVWNLIRFPVAHENLFNDQYPTRTKAAVVLSSLEMCKMPGHFIFRKQVLRNQDVGAPFPLTKTPSPVNPIPSIRKSSYEKQTK